MVNVPHEYDALLSFVPSADKPSQGTFFVDYPGMRPWPFGSNRCESLCEGQIVVEVSTGSEPSMNRQAWALSREIQAASQQGSQGTAPKYSISALPPLSGYTQALQKIDLKPSEMLSLPIEAAIYLRAMADGRPLEFVECATLMPKFQGEPFCQVYTTLDGYPAVHIGLRYHIRQWPEREAIRAAVMQLVRSWL